MSAKRLSPLFAFCLLFPVAAIQTQQSASSAAPTRDPQALTILTQCLQAAGGSQAIAAIQDFTASGSITYYWARQQVAGDVTIKGRGLTQFRMDASVGNGVRSVVVNGSSGSVKHIDGTTRTFSADELAYFASPTFPPTQVEIALQDTSANITFIGDRTTGVR
jgi:hypothetical protein